MATMAFRGRRKGRILKIRCTEETVRVWREQLRKYQDAGLTAEDLLLDALRLAREHGLPRVAPVF